MKFNSTKQFYFTYKWIHKKQTEQCRKETEKRDQKSINEQIMPVWLFFYLLTPLLIPDSTQLIG